MPTYKTPGVYIEEISTFPPSIAAVETAIPAFIGYTQKTVDPDGVSMINDPRRITSLVEFEALFGTASIQDIDVDVTQTAGVTKVTFNGPAVSMPADLLYYSMRMFFANGGGPCYIVTVGDDPAAGTQQDFTDAIDALEGFDEPTLIVFPDATSQTIGVHGNVVNAALAHCNKLQDRFTIADVHNAVSGGTDTIAEINTYRGNLSSDLNEVKYGAAYFPYLRTSVPFVTDDANITIKTHTVDGAAGSIAADTAISDNAVKQDETAIYNAVKQFVNGVTVTLPPSGAVAGIYARVDADRGVWKAPANVSVKNVIGPTVTITDDLNDALNIDATTGKSINAIRAFAGKGTLVWGARTLAGNDNEFRYVPVRRFFNFVEESIKKAVATFVFEPNDANTWTKTRSMIESFLVRQWRDGALAGAKPEDAFDVSVGLNQTMTAQDILDGLMIVEIGLAVVRPAEFIVLRFVQRMQRS